MCQILEESIYIENYVEISKKLKNISLFLFISLLLFLFLSFIVLKYCSMIRLKNNEEYVKLKYDKHIKKRQQFVLLRF